MNILKRVVSWFQREPPPREEEAPSHLDAYYKGMTGDKLEIPCVFCQGTIILIDDHWPEWAHKDDCTEWRSENWKSCIPPREAWGKSEVFKPLIFHTYAKDSFESLVQHSYHGNRVAAIDVVYNSMSILFAGSHFDDAQWFIDHVVDYAKTHAMENGILLSLLTVTSPYRDQVKRDHLYQLVQELNSAKGPEVTERMLHGL